ncbi:MAG: hypothetical protein FJZ01_09385 [Candidatus Sericytochromatia bacterium]|nr:hypothetical protein [Candidatus Tanganyikabacteria bacterium]
MSGSLPGQGTILAGVLGAAALACVVAGCGLVDTSTCEQGPTGPAGEPYTFLALVVPEKRCESVAFPLTTDHVGGVVGRIVDSAGLPVEGAKVFAGGSSTLTGPIPRTDPFFSLVAKSEQAKHRKTLDPGEFVLENLPLQNTVVTVQYDDQTFPFQMKPASTASFNLAKAAADGQKYGLLDKGDIPIDLKLPDDGAYGVRIVNILPSALSATATGSKVTFTAGSIVALSLRNGPHGNSAEVTKVKIEYLDEQGNKMGGDVTKTPSPTIVPASTVTFSAGAITTLAVDVADTRLGTTGGNASARITLTVKDLKTNTESSAGDYKVPLTRTVPIQITRQ